MTQQIKTTLQHVLPPEWLQGIHELVFISGIQNDSRLVKPGDLFIAYAGAKADGRRFIEQAWQQGAAAVLIEADQCAVAQSHHGRWLLQAPRLRSHLSQIASRFFQEPSQHCTVIGITGTNGKTTLCYVLAQALQQLGHRCAMIGTLGQGFLHQLTETANTTPDALAVQRHLAGFVSQGAEYVVMEVSSHGIDQDRVTAVHFDTAVLTQIGRDHLDYHQTLAAYVAVKTRLFCWPGLRHVVINGDDAFAAHFLSAISPDILSTRYGLTADLDITAQDWQPSEEGSCAWVVRRAIEQECASLQTLLWGQFNVYNLLAALSVLLGLGIDFNQALDVLAAVSAPPGRLELVSRDGQAQPCVLVDYAHTPDALEVVLSTIRQHCRQRWQQGGQLICIFGCGGERDKGKRPLMGGVASAQADKVILTMDNPRSEDPLIIIQQIQAGCDAAIECQVILDRGAAIDHAIQQAQRHDVILIAGKGHETTQIMGSHSFPSDDRVFARRALSNYWPIG